MRRPPGGGAAPSTSVPLSHACSAWPYMNRLLSWAPAATSAFAEVLASMFTIGTA